MPTFGYRTRLFEALYLADNNAQKSFAVQKELADWAAQRYELRYQNAKVTSVRFVAGLHRNDMKKIPEGYWQKPSFESFAPADTYELSRHIINNIRP